MRRESGHDRTPDRGLLGSEPLDQTRLDRIDRIESRGKMPQQNNWIVVALVDRKPCERSRILGSPLRENRGLSIARRSNDDDCGEGAGGTQSVDESCPRDTGSAGGPECQPRLDHVEREAPLRFDEHGLRAGISKRDNRPRSVASEGSCWL